MSKEMWVIALGVWTIVVPYLGIYSSWKTVLFVLTGVAVASLGFLLRGEALARGVKHTEHHPFVENQPSSQADTATSERHDNQERITSLN